MIRLAALIAACCLIANAASAGIVEQYEAQSDSWHAAQAAGGQAQANACDLARRYDEVMADIDLALVKGQLLLVRPNLRYLDLGEQDRRELRAFYGRLEQAHSEADQRCRH